MTPAFSLCVYCGSKPGADQAYAQIAHRVGLWIGRNGGQLVYGGSNNGLMGIVATATLEAGGNVVGVIPQSLVKLECAKTDCTQLHIVDTMQQRKLMMAELADAFLALPGGIGTLEELFETWSWRQLGHHNKPVGLMDFGGYFKPMLHFLEQAQQAGFINAHQMDLITVGHEVEPLLSELCLTHKAVR
jgi:uncharacterized protein (TIGR00730 family)